MLREEVLEVSLMPSSKRPVSQILEDEQPLLDTARLILDAVLAVWKRRDCIWDYCQSDLDIFVRHIPDFPPAPLEASTLDSNADSIVQITNCGVPAAGALCIALLKQIQPTGSSKNLNFHRSETIQNLSVFICCLDWVRPTDAAYNLCGRMRKIISRILDRILNLPPALELAVNAAAGSRIEETPNVTTSSDDTDFLDWLDTIDWTKGPMMDLS
ncbi:MAG: hypothetical protein Q9191_005998 [Dirinaria sp. TL-2023a]